MSSKDYLLKQIQQLAKVLAVLMGLKEKGKYQQAADEVDHVLNDWFGLNTILIEELPENEFSELVKKRTKNIEEAKIVAELVYQQTIIFNKMEKYDKSAEWAAKALQLFCTVDEQGDTFSIEIQQRIAELDQMVDRTV